MNNYLLSISLSLITIISGYYSFTHNRKKPFLTQYSTISFFVTNISIILVILIYSMNDMRHAIMWSWSYAITSLQFIAYIYLLVLGSYRKNKNWVIIVLGLLIGGPIIRSLQILYLPMFGYFLFQPYIIIIISAVSLIILKNNLAQKKPHISYYFALGGLTGVWLDFFLTDHINLYILLISDASSKYYHMSGPTLLPSAIYSIACLLVLLNNGNLFWLNYYSITTNTHDNLIREGSATTSPTNCPKCNKSITVEAVFCKYCGHKLN